MQSCTYNFYSNYICLVHFHFAWKFTRDIPIHGNIDTNHNIQCCKQCKTEVYNAKTEQWVSKDAAPRSSICYFPNTWTKAKTVSYLQGMYNDPCFQRILRNNDANIGALNICFRPQDLLGDGWNVWIFLGARNDKNKVDRPISTAFLNKRRSEKEGFDGCTSKITCTRA